MTTELSLFHITGFFKRSGIAFTAPSYMTSFLKHSNLFGVKMRLCITSFCGHYNLTRWKIKHIFETFQQNQLKPCKSIHYTTLGYTRLKYSYQYKKSVPRSRLCKAKLIVFCHTESNCSVCTLGWHVTFGWKTWSTCQKLKKMTERLTKNKYYFATNV